MSPANGIAFASLALLTGLAAAPAGAVTMAGLTADNKLVWIDTDKKTASAPKPITGTDQRIVGIDVRPANGKLYAVSAGGQIFTLAPDTGVLTPVSQIAEKVELGAKPVVDFNPVADRLRVISVYGTSLRINVENGQTVVDKPLAFDAADANAARRPMIAAGAYINAVAGAKATELFHVDHGAGALLLQNPPNDGVLKTKGALGMKLAPMAAMDVMSKASGENTAYLLSGKALYAIDLASAKTMAMGSIAGIDGDIIDIAVLPQ
jgi:hypothetical protein